VTGVTSVTSVRRIHLPGVGDRYDGVGTNVTLNGRPVTEVETAMQGPKIRPIYPALGLPDPVLEREQALLGAVLLDWCEIEDVDRAIENPFLRQIVDALAQIELGTGDRVTLAIQWCRGLGIDRVLLGASRSRGFLAGCVHRARQMPGPRPTRQRPRPENRVVIDEKPAQEAPLDDAWTSPPPDALPDALPNALPDALPDALPEEGSAMPPEDDVPEHMPEDMPDDEQPLFDPSFDSYDPSFDEP
jgi:hypothetical protein